MLATPAQLLDPRSPGHSVTLSRVTVVGKDGGNSASSTSSTSGIVTNCNMVARAARLRQNRRVDFSAPPPRLARETGSTRDTQLSILPGNRRVTACQVRSALSARSSFTSNCVSSICLRVGLIRTSSFAEGPTNRQDHAAMERLGVVERWVNIPQVPVARSGCR